MPAQQSHQVDVRIISTHPIAAQQRRVKLGRDDTVTPDGKHESLLVSGRDESQTSVGAIGTNRGYASSSTLCAAAQPQGVSCAISFSRVDDTRPNTSTR